MVVQERYGEVLLTEPGNVSFQAKRLGAFLQLGAREIISDEWSEFAIYDRCDAGEDSRVSLKDTARWDIDPMSQGLPQWREASEETHSWNLLRLSVMSS